jgi:predicted outer membrane repeat protein
MEANALPGADRIRINPATYNLTLPETGNDAGGDLDVTESVILENAGAPPILDGQDDFRIFETSGSTVSLTVRGVVMRNGSADFGGCVRAGGDLVLERVELASCDATDSGGALFVINGALTVRDAWIHDSHAGATGSGGGLSFLENLTTPERALLERVTFSGNTANRGGAVRAGGEMVFVNVTMRGNSASEVGGAIWATDTGRLSNVTIVGNVCDTDDDGDSGGGIFKSTPGAWTFENSVLARNTCGTSAPIWQDCDGTFTSGGYNLVGIGADCTGFAATGDVVGPGPVAIDPLLGPLAMSGGWAPTSLPLTGSPVLQGGNPAGCVADRDGTGPDVAVPLTDDQRRAARPADGTCERGAVELGPFFLDGFESRSTGAWSATVL